MTSEVSWFSRLVEVEGELGDRHDGELVGVCDGVHAQAVEGSGGVVEADDVGMGHQVWSVFGGSESRRMRAPVRPMACAGIG
jgi:hypothetical protein